MPPSPAASDATSGADRESSPRHVGPEHFELGPATRMLWRGPDTVHFELGGRAVTVTGLPLQVIRSVATPSSSLGRGSRAPGTGSRASTATTATTAAAAGINRSDRRAGPIDAATRDALTALAEAGYLWPRPTSGPRGRPPAGTDRTPTEPRLSGELTALAVQHGSGAGLMLAARRHASVVVVGSSRVAPQIAALVAAAGVGRVRCQAGGSVALRHAAPGGVDVADEGEPLSDAAARAIRRAAPKADETPLRLGAHPDLTVLAVEGPVDDDHRAALHADDATHLLVQLGVDDGVVGPLVIPGRTSCLRCADLHRRDRDPAWAALAVQLTVAPRHGRTSAVAVAAVIAGVAATQIVAHLDRAAAAGADGRFGGKLGSGLDGDPEPSAAIEASLELHLPDWRLRRRPRPPHPDCDCGAGAPDPGGWAQ